MRLDPLQQSDDIEDRRGTSSGGGILGSGAGRIGIGGMILAAVAYFVFGISPTTTLSMVSAINSMTGGSEASSTGSKGLRTADEQAVFASKVLQSTKEVWNEAVGGKYPAPTMVLYNGRTQTACGLGQAAAGPFYCPGDHQLYLDMNFFHDLSTRFGAPGDFAQAYVIAHEVGHHVQNLLGISDKVHAAQQRASEAGKNQLQVRMELQADCYAGIWAYRADQERHILEAGDVEEALAAASGVGDDRLQQQSQGVVVPESFTHGSSEQRMTWFSRGAKSGDPRQCDTFKSGTV